MPGSTVPRGYPYQKYTDFPMDFPAAIQALAQSIDADVTTVADRIPAARQRPSVRMTASATQAIAANTSTAVVFTGGAAIYDNTGMANPGANRLQITEPGIYWLTARVVVTALGSGAAYGLRVSILSSGGIVATPATVTRYAHPIQDAAVSVSGLHIKTGGGTDFITLNVQTNASSSRNLTFRNLCATKISNVMGGS